MPGGVDQYATQAMLGYTTSLQKGSGEGAGTTWTDVGEVTDLTVWDASRDTVEVTNHRSPGFSVENIPGLIDWGSASFELNLVPAMAANPATPVGSLLEDFKSAGNSPWRVVFPDETTVSFLAALTSYQVTAPVKDVLKGSFELKISGEPQFGTANGGPGAASAGFSSDTGSEYSAA